MMPYFSYLTVNLYSLSEKALISKIIRPLFPIFFLPASHKSKFIFNKQLVSDFLNDFGFEKYFPLKTVMGPSGPITHCYALRRKSEII